MKTTVIETDSSRDIRSAFQESRWLLMAYGIILIILGGLAIAAPSISTVAVDIYIGWLFLIAGVVGVVAMFSARDVSAFLWSLLTAALAIIIGAMLIWNPTKGAVSLTALLTTFFIVEGIAQIIISFSYRDMLPEQWGWMLASGIADLVLAAVIISGWPASASWTLGVLAGVNLITSGIAIFIPAAAAGE